MKVTSPVSSAHPVPERPVAPQEKVQAGQPQEEQRKAQPLTKEESERLADKMNAAAELFNKAVEFKVFEKNRIIIRVIDKTTDEVITEFPPERLLEALRSMERSLGLLLDEKV